MIGPTLKQELDAREYEMVGLLAFGYRFEQIGQVVGLGVDSIKKTFARMYEKTGTADQLELACRFAYERSGQ